MNKVVISIGILVVLIAGAAIYLGRNLNGIVEGVIEREGTAAVGSEVSVGLVEIDLGAGTATISDFSVANPAGFSEQDMLRFDQLSVTLDLQSLRSELPRITSITASNPFVLYEMANGTSNLDTVRARFPAEDAPAEGTAPGQRLAIDSIVIAGIQARMEADRLPRPVTVPLGDIRLQDLEGTVDEISAAVTRPLIAQLSRNAATALIAATGSLLQENLGEDASAALRELRGETTERLDEVQDQVGEVLDRSGLGDLFRRNQE